jgi:hypothetical protein
MLTLRLVCFAAGALLAVTLIGDRPRQFLAAAYPSDPFKREALAKCLNADPTFIRFFAEQRNACYLRMGAL